MRIKLNTTVVAAVACVAGMASTAQGLFIDNGVVGDTRLVVDALVAGDTQLALFDPLGVLVQAGFISNYLWYADIGKDGSAEGLGAMSSGKTFSVLNNNTVVSSGHFDGENGMIAWETKTSIPAGSVQYVTELTFSSGQPFGKLRLTDYLNADIYGFGDDELVTSKGLPGGGNWLLPVTVDKQLKVEVYSSFSGLSGVEYVGWSADTASLLKSKILNSSAVFSPNGNVNTQELSAIFDQRFPHSGVFGFGDVASALAFDLDPGARSARLVTTLNFSTPEPGSLAVLGVGLIGLVVRRERRGR